jgi:hypothetical protein
MWLCTFCMSATVSPIVSTPNDRPNSLQSNRWSEWQGKRESSQKNLHRYRSVRHRSHVYFHGLEHGPSRWEAGDFRSGTSEIRSARFSSVISKARRPDTDLTVDRLRTTTPPVMTAAVSRASSHIRLPVRPQDSKRLQITGTFIITATILQPVSVQRKQAEDETNVFRLYPASQYIYAKSSLKRGPRIVKCYEIIVHEVLRLNL